MDSVDKIAEQESRFRLLVADLVEVAAFIPPHAIVSPRYSIGADRVWRVEFQTGDIGWVRALGMYRWKNPKYFVPPAIAAECLLREATELRLTVAWANSVLSIGVDQERLREAILAASPGRQSQLQRDVDAIRLGIRQADQVPRVRKD